MKLVQLPVGQHKQLPQVTGVSQVISVSVCFAYECNDRVFCGKCNPLVHYWGVSCGHQIL